MRWKTQHNNKQKRGLTFSDIAVAIIVIALAAFLAWPTMDKPQLDGANSNVISGYATVNDGDSLTINSKKIRLLGIDAPELHQFCGYQDQQYACGQESKKHLEKLLRRQPVKCLWDKKDQYVRELAVCLVDEEPVNAAMVRDGWAVSYYDYPQEEKQAKADKKGLWNAPFQWPRNWRRSHPR